MICIYPANAHTHTRVQIFAHSSLQAKTEAVARAVCLCEWWAVRLQVRPTQSPSSRTVCTTHWLRRGQDGRQNKEELMHAWKKKEKKKPRIFTHTYTLASYPCQKFTPVPALPLHCCPLSVKDMIVTLHQNTVKSVCISTDKDQ